MFTPLDFRRPLLTPLVSSLPRLRSTKVAAWEDDMVPKHSARLAAKSKFRAAKPEAQARKVMLKKLGAAVETEKPDEASFAEFQQVFALPLSPSEKEGMRVLFPGKHRGRAPVAPAALS